MILRKTRRIKELERQVDLLTQKLAKKQRRRFTDQDVHDLRAESKRG